MASSVYSVQFFAVAPTSTITTHYTVPAGYVAVLRSMTFGWSVVARTVGVTGVFMVSTANRIWNVAIDAPGQGSAVWDGRVVFNAGQTMRSITNATGSLWLTGSGYLLSLP